MGMLRYRHPWFGVAMILDIPRYLEMAFDDPKLDALGMRYAAVAMDKLASYQFDDSVIHASDLGKCKRMVWARIHNANTIPIHWTKKLKYFKFGALYGALLGAYLKAGIESTDPEVYKRRVEVMLEPELHYRGAVGHTDALVVLDGEPFAAVEFKTNMNTDPPKPPHTRNTYQVLQAGFSAVAAPCPTFYVVTVGPAVENRMVGGTYTTPQIYDCSPYDTKEWQPKIDADLDRLQVALDKEPPDYDPPAAWWCRLSCQFAACPKNTSVDKPKEAIA